MSDELESISESLPESSPHEAGFAKLSSLCSLLPRPRIMTGIIREVLIWHFADPNLIEQPDLKEFVWTKEVSSKILIESIHQWRPKTTGTRPAIVIKPNGYSKRRLGIGNRLQTPSADKEGTPNYGAMWVGSHTVFCIGGTGAQAELLGTEVQREIDHFAELIRRSFMLHRIEVLEVGSVAELEDQIEQFAVPVTIGYAWMENYKVRQQAPVLRKISLTTFLSD